MAVDALMDRKTSLVVSPRPLAREEEVSLHALPEGLSLAEMVVSLEVSGTLDPALRPWVRISVSGVKVSAGDWSGLRPRADDTVVLEVAPMAGSNAVRTLLQIAVIALSVWVPGAIGLSGLAAAGATAAVNVGGMIAVNAIAPIKQPEVAGREQRYSLDAGSNAARPHEAIPIIMGRRRIYPPRCANWYTVTVNNTVYLRQMFQPCVTWVDHEGARIGQTDLASFEGVNVRWSTRHDEGLEPIWFQRTPAEDSLALPVKQASGWITRAAPLESDALSIDVAFMAGLFETKESSGNPKNRSVTFEFRYGPRGGDPSSAAPCPFAGAGGLLTFTRDKLDSYRLGWEWPVARGQYDVHVRRITNEESNNPKISDELTWICIRSFRDEAPVRDLASKPWIELELQASDQLNGVPNDFNFIATSIVPEATATGPGDLIVSRNPADLFLAASYPPMSDVELDDDERAFAAIADWRATCEQQGWMCDLAEASEMSVGELLQRTAAAGRARPTLDYGALSVVVDWEKPLPRQMFTPRNVSGFRGDLVYPAPVHALRVRFANAEKDFADDVVTVFGQKPDGTFYDLDTADKYERVEVRDKVDADAVVLEGARMLAERVLRPEKFSFEQDVEYLTIREGDRAWLAHHVALVGEITGRVRARVTDESDPSLKGLRLDELVTMVAGRSYDLAWRPSADAALEVFPLETLPGQSDIVWFAAPIPSIGDQPLPGDQVTVFDHAVELLDVVVDRIAPKEGLKASITCVPYAEALQSVGDEPIPAYRTGVSRPPTLGGAVVVRRDGRAIEKVIDALAEGVSQAGNGVDIIAEQVGAIEAASRKAQLDILDARMKALGDLKAFEAILRQVLSGKPLGEVIAEQRQVLIDTNVVVGNNTAAIASEAVARQTAISAEAYQRTVLATDYNGFKATTSAELISISTATSTVAANLATVSTDYNGFKASASATLISVSNATSATAASLAALESTVAANKASADAGLLTVASDVSALSTQYTSLDATVAANKASADSSLSVLTTNVSAAASQITTLQSNVTGLSATVSSQASTLADVASKVAVARFVVEAAASGGRPARLALYSDSLGGSNIALSAAKIYFGDNTVLDDASDTLRSDLGSAAYIQAWGEAFGASSDLLLWFGPNGIGHWAASRSNAYFYLAKTAPYLGGSAVPTGGGSGGFEVNLSTPLVSGNRFGTGSATTDTVTATTSGGDGTVTYSWAYLSGASFSPSSTTGDAVAFTGSITALGQTLDGYWRVTARDSAGHVAFADVRILISENS
ncbi:hypothetical protein CA606_18560 [Caulobacter vibrioides]|uniref:Tip attachment protein J HDII-ins2 domain-containing protein n=1 Tax=Caulobacter vibrioides TaxID=155892 RepID=A0A290MWA3_CAUVI|nr:hypothetical protein [Caulobacter vibrioides]ATC34173.1 hypothetical protein CA606_18560 [Caulobacter vibrioides]